MPRISVTEPTEVLAAMAIVEPLIVDGFEVAAAAKRDVDVGVDVELDFRLMLRRLKLEVVKLGASELLIGGELLPSTAITAEFVERNELRVTEIAKLLDVVVAVTAASLAVVVVAGAGGLLPRVVEEGSTLDAEEMEPTTVAAVHEQNSAKLDEIWSYISEPQESMMHCIS